MWDDAAMIKIPLRFLAVAAVALAGLMVAGCGSDDAKQANDAASLIRAESLVLVEENGAIAACGEDVACLREAGERAAVTLRGSLQRVEARRSEISGECATRAIDSFLAYGRALRAVAISARGGAVDDVYDAYGTATLRSSEFVEVTKSCGFAPEGASDVSMNKLQPILLRISEIGQEFDACGDFSCVSDVASRLESSVRDGIVILDEAAAGDLSVCERELINTLRKSFFAYRDGAQLIQEGDASAEARFEEGLQHEREFATMASDCMGESSS